MSISAKTRKLLWARSGNQCAICAHRLITDESSGAAESVVGDECHIVASSKDGPRGEVAAPDTALDDYANLILLCKIHHKQVDDQPFIFTADTLRRIKAKHEAQIRKRLSRSRRRIVIVALALLVLSAPFVAYRVIVPYKVYVPAKGTDPHRDLVLAQRAKSSIGTLSEIGFARDIELGEEIVDRDGNSRKVDLSFILTTWAVEIRVSAKCVSGMVTIQQVDEITSLKAHLADRNIFWLITEQEPSPELKSTLKAAAISVYAIKDLEEIIKGIIRAYKGSRIEELRRQTRMFSVLSPDMYGRSAAMLRDEEMTVLAGLGDICDMLSKRNSDFSLPYEEPSRR
jgi:hypothetical protein